MKTTKLIQTLTTTAICFLFSAGLATAHSEHDNTRHEMQWKFSKKVEAKIQSRGTLENNGYYIGLSKHQLNALSHYGIRPGNLFSAKVDGSSVHVKRTTAGIQIAAADVMDISMKEQLPIRPLSWISMVSTGNTMNHAGHEHSVKPYEWSFGETTQDRLAQRLGNKDEVFVGLNHFEQTLLDNYDIKVGNRIHTVVKGQILMAERTSGGMKIIGIASNQVAQAEMGRGRM